MTRGTSDSPTPGFQVVQAIEEPFHTGTICMGGTVCQARLVDRRLGDYFSVEVDGTGALVAAYSDTRQGGPVALAAFLRQTGGESFLAPDDGDGVDPGRDEAQGRPDDVPPDRGGGPECEPPRGNGCSGGPAA